MCERLTKELWDECPAEEFSHFVELNGTEVKIIGETWAHPIVSGEAIDRLAAYEDSGLTPEEIQELAKAKAEGRLAVLPCKVGDTVYITTHGIIKETQVRTFFIGHPSYNRGEPDPSFMMVRCTNFDLPFERFGETAFLSREEAEKAIAEVGGND